MYKKMFIVCMLIMAQELFADDDTQETVITPELIVAVFGERGESNTPAFRFMREFGLIDNHDKKEKEMSLIKQNNEKDCT